jgi:hypothetical protein
VRMAVQLSQVVLSAHIQRYLLDSEAGKPFDRGVRM